jgi:hypothetical protein
MATAKQIRAAVARATQESLEREPKNSDRRAVHFVCFLAGWLHKDDPAIAEQLRKVADLAPPLGKGA